MTFIRRLLLVCCIVLGVTALTPQKADAFSIDVSGYSDSLNALGLGSMGDWISSNLTSLNGFMSTYGEEIQQLTSGDFEILDGLGFIGADPELLTPLTDLLGLVDTLCNTNLNVNMSADFQANFNLLIASPFIDFECSPTFTTTANINLDFNAELALVNAPFAASSGGGGGGIPVYGSLSARTAMAVPIANDSFAGPTPAELLQARSVPYRESATREARQTGISQTNSLIGGLGGPYEAAPGINRTWSCSDFSWKKQYKDMYQERTLRLYTEGISDGVAATAPIALLQSYSPNLASISMHLKLLTALDLNSAKMECATMAQTMENRFGETLRSPGYAECLSQFADSGLEVALQICGSPTSPFLGAEIDGKIASVGPLADAEASPGAGAMDDLSDAIHESTFAGTDFIARAVAASVAEITPASLIDQGLSTAEANRLAEIYNSPVGRSMTGRHRMKTTTNAAGEEIREPNYDDMHQFFGDTLGALTVDNLAAFEFTRGDLKNWQDDVEVKTSAYISDDFWDILRLHGQLVLALVQMTEESVYAIKEASTSTTLNDTAIIQDLEFQTVLGPTARFELNLFMNETPSGPFMMNPHTGGRRWENNLRDLSAAISTSRLRLIQRLPHFMNTPWRSLELDVLNEVSPLTLDKWGAIVHSYMSFLEASRPDAGLGSIGTNWEADATASILRSEAGYISRAILPFQRYNPMQLSIIAVAMERAHFYDSIVWPINFPFIANEVGTSLGGLNHPSVQTEVTKFLDHSFDMRKQLSNQVRKDWQRMNVLVGEINSYDFPLGNGIQTLSSQPENAGVDAGSSRNTPSRVIISDY